MNINAIRYECLTKEEIEVWSHIQRTEPMLASPYFRPEFTRAVAAVRNDVEIAVLKDGARPIGFLPFQRSRRNVGHPVGGKLSDFHGLIAPGDSNWDPLEILRGCGLSALHFDHLLSDQRAFSPYICREVDSPYIDLSKGLDKYISQRTNGTRIMAEYRHDTRKLVREIGPLRFEAHVADRAIVSTLLAWKTAHLRQMQVPNILDYSWVRNLLDTILENQSSDFSALMSVVYASDAVAAINFGIRTSTVLHLWFQTYNVELARYSPGLLCVVETMKAAESLGIRHIDFGTGPETYKYRMMSGVTRVAEGTADSRCSAATIRRAWWSAKDRIRTSALAAPARRISHNVRRARHWLDARIANQRTYS